MLFGITHAYAANELDETAVHNWIVALRAQMVAAGAAVFQDEPPNPGGEQWLYAGRAGLSVSPAHPIDDSPCWQIHESYGYASLLACTCPQDLPNEANNSFGNTGIEPAFQPTTLLAAGDPVQGWWWHMQVDMSNPAAPAIDTLFSIVNARRYPADMYQGIAARFGSVHIASAIEAPALSAAYRIKSATGLAEAPATYYITGPAGRHPLIRHATSPTARHISPIYMTPADATEYTPAIMGELDSIMMATNGYTWGEQALPGWKVFGSANQGYLALRAPDTFATV